MCRHPLAVTTKRVRVAPCEWTRAMALLPGAHVRMMGVLSTILRVSSSDPLQSLWVQPVWPAVTEAELGTNPLSSDSDGDGVSDLAETDCDSDPLDGENACGACDWGNNDPGTLTATGSDLGDTIANIELVDQCGAVNNLWDFYGEYHVLYMTAAW